MTAQVKLWGNSQAIRIPKAVLDSLKIGIDDYVSMEIEGDSLVIRKNFKHKTLKERYEEFDGEIETLCEYDWGEPVGREVW